MTNTMTNEEIFFSNLREMYPNVEKTWNLLWSAMQELDVPEFGTYELLSSSAVEILNYVKDAEGKMYCLMNQLENKVLEQNTDKE